MSDEQNLERNSILVSGLADTIKDGESGLNRTPKFVKKIIEQDAWKRRTLRCNGEVVEFESFTNFVESHPPDGLGVEVDMLKRMCKEHDEALRLLRDAVTDSPGGDQRSEEAQTKNDNISNESGQGTSKDYTLDRLAREAPELYKQVVADEISANAAAIEAGFRTKTASVPVHKGGEEQHERAAKSLAKHFDDFEGLVEAMLTEHTDDPEALIELIQNHT